MHQKSPNKSVGLHPNVWTKVLLLTQKEKSCFAPNMFEQKCLFQQKFCFALKMIEQKFNFEPKMFDQKFCFGPQM